MNLGLSAQRQTEASRPEETKTTIKRTETSSNLGEEGKFLTLLEDDFKNQTLPNDHINSDTAELWYVPPTRVAVGLASTAKQGETGRGERRRCRHLAQAACPGTEEVPETTGTGRTVRGTGLRQLDSKVKVQKQMHDRTQKLRNTLLQKHQKTLII